MAETAVLPSLSLFELPLVQSAIEDERFVEVNPMSAIGDGPISFRYTNSRAFLRLNASYLLFEFRILDSAGNPIPAANSKFDGGKDAVDQVAPINHIGSTMIRQAMLYLQGQKVNDSGPLYAYRSYIDLELGNSKEDRVSLFEPGLYHFDEAPGKKTCKGHKERHTKCGGSKIVQVASPIFLDLFQQHRPLPNFVDLHSQLFMNSNDFVLESFADPAKKFTFKLINAKLMLKEVYVHESVGLSMEKLLQQNHRIHLPHVNTIVRSSFVSAGRTSTSEVQLLNSKIPNRLIFGFVKGDNYVGTQGTCPFVFEHCNVKSVTVQAGGVTVPAKPWTISFSDDRFTEAYMKTLDSLNQFSTGKGSGMTMDRWKNSHCLFAFNLLPSTDTELVDLVRRGNVTLRVDFDKPVEGSGLYLICFIQSNSILSLDSQREPTVDTIV